MINKELLLTVESIELFKLHLPTISGFIENIPDYFHLISIQDELRTILGKYYIRTCYNKSKIESLFHKFPLSEEMILYYTSSGIDPIFDEMLKDFELSEKNNIFMKIFDRYGYDIIYTHLLDDSDKKYVNENLSLIKLIEDRNEGETWLKTTFLLKPKEIKNENNRIEYLKWLIELSSALQCSCELDIPEPKERKCEYNEEPHVLFWHPPCELKKIAPHLFSIKGLTKYNQKIYKNILPYIESGICSFIPICEHECKFCGIDIN